MRRTSMMLVVIVSATIAIAATAAAAVEPIVSPRADPYLRDGLKGTKGFGANWWS